MWIVRRTFPETVVVSIIEWLRSDSGQVFVAGGAGATASAVDKWPGLFAAARQIGIGTVTAYYLSDYASPLFKWLAGISDIPADKASAPGAFLVGATGMVIFETILQAVSLKSRKLNAEIHHGKADT